MFARFFATLLLGLTATLFVSSPAIAGEKFDGKVLTVSEDHHLTIQHQDDQRTFVVNGDTKFMLDGEEARWEDIKPGFTVEIQADRDGDQFVARSVMAYADE